MSKVKQWAWDTAEKAVDNILDDFKSGKYNSTVAKNKITMVDNLELVGIDEFNVDEVIDDFKVKNGMVA
tara:strand:+ start:553 stop:759 length:207 start_codon:yes stop_codon:yes gene_type:complete